METTESEPGSNPPEARRSLGAMPRRIPVPILVGAGLWLCVVVGAMIAVLNAANVPGASGEAPLRWPSQSRIPLDTSRPTLVMFVHPHCPCTRASMEELNRLMTRSLGKCSAYVMFLQPTGMAEDWTRTGLWGDAAAIPGANVRADAAGIEAGNFHAETSGQTVLYDTGGRLLFQGGITISRGHSGDNPGRSALIALLDHEPLPQVKTPVFGCSLIDQKCRTGEVQ